MSRKIVAASFALLVPLVLLFLHAAACAQQGAGLYVGPGRVLQAASPRQLSLNAHVSGFLFQPGGLSIAYVGVHDEDGARTVSVKLVGARNTDSVARTLYTASGDTADATGPDSHVPIVDLIGWTPDARYLILRQEDANNLGAQYVSVDVGKEPLQVRQVQAPDVPAGYYSGGAGFAWSPDRLHLLMSTRCFRTDTAPPGSPMTTTVAAVYDPATDQMLPVTISDGLRVLGWQDNNHLLLVHRKEKPGDKDAFFSHDVATDMNAALPGPSSHEPAQNSAMMFVAQSTDPANTAFRGMRLETKDETLIDGAQVAHADARTLWVRQRGAPKALSAVSVGITPGADDPQAAWSPNGKSVAFVAHGDLFVTDLTERDATPYEKVAAGEKLSCDEERDVIASNMKQLGLGLLQYTQDYDENFPPANGWHDAVYPYVQNESMFNFAGIPVVYHAPANLSLRSMTSPADTVLATADTPCAHLVLFVDGHVKAFDKDQDSAPAG